jgi:hypothetical protein
MDVHSIIDLAFGTAMAAIGWFLKTLWEAVKDLQTADRSLSDKVSHIEVLVAGQYVKVDKFDQMMTAIFTKLDRIEDKLSQKVDK